jgi:hypothetical protein
LTGLAKLIDFICRAPFFAPCYNIALLQQAPVIVLENNQPTMKLMHTPSSFPPVSSEMHGYKHLDATRWFQSNPCELQPSTKSKSWLFPSN